MTALGKVVDSMETHFSAFRREFSVLEQKQNPLAPALADDDDDDNDRSIVENVVGNNSEALVDNSRNGSGAGASTSAGASELTASMTVMKGVSPAFFQEIQRQKEVKILTDS